MKPLVIDCSPRQGGNSDIIVAHIARENDVDTLYLRDKDYVPCNGCGACETLLKCVHDDDASRIYEDIERRDTIVFVSPVYFFGFPAHSKAFIDRAQYKWSVPREKDNHKSVYLIGVGGQRREDIFDPLIRTLECFALTIGARFAGGLYFHSVDDKGEVDSAQNMARVDDFMEKILR